MVAPKPDAPPPKPEVVNAAMPGQPGDMKVKDPYRQPADHAAPPNTNKAKAPETRRDAPMTVPQRQLNHLRKDEEQLPRKEGDALKKVADRDGKDKKGEEAAKQAAGFGLQELRGAGRPMVAGELAAMAPAPPPLPFVVRQYAHPPSEHAAGDERSDFAETLYWHPALVLANGKGEVSFNLCDSVTTFQVAVIGHTLDGRIGAATVPLQSRLPFTLEPKLPIEVTSSDKIDIPVSIANNTGEARDVTLRFNAIGLVPREDASRAKQLTVGAQQRMRHVLRQPGEGRQCRRQGQGAEGNPRAGVEVPELRRGSLGAQEPEP